MPKTYSATSVIVDVLPQCVLVTPGCCEPTRRLKTIAENVMIVSLYLLYLKDFGMTLEVVNNRSWIPGIKIWTSISASSPPDTW